MGALSHQELSFRQIEPNNFYVSKSQRRALALPSKNRFKGISAEYMQNRLANTLPSIMHNFEKHSTMMQAGVKSKPKNHATEKDGGKSDVSNIDYITSIVNDMPDWYTGNQTKLQMSASGDGRGYDTNREVHANYYSRLKLGKNVLNFFHVSHRFIQARVDTLKVDEFEGLMDVGTVLLKEGEHGLDGRLEVGVAARMLKEAAVRFAAASDINPSSVVAIDAWGTTLLAHGKLKLLLSEKLRDMLLEAKAPRKKLDTETTVATLEDMIAKVCEDCEKLLVEAGRKFGKSVSMDKSNDFALYNWGLALFYRARLITTDGMEDAMKDADKIYLTAVDKFKATIQLSKDYSGAAYLSWGLALRDRYWLHGLASKGDVRLLEQAKWASDQAIQAYPNAVEAELVVLACMEELAQFQTE